MKENNKEMKSFLKNKNLILILILFLNDLVYGGNFILDKSKS
jgi:hypothetical protein